jgi:tetratricopeptide (TPR) repeat protein
MKKILFFTITFFLTTFCLFAESFEEFNIKISNESNIEKLKEYKQEELNKFIKSKKSYFFYNVKYVDFYIADREENQNQAIAALSWVIEDLKGTDNNQLAWFNYHMASNLNAVKAHKIALTYAIKSNKLAQLTNSAQLLQLTNSLVGSVYFQLKNFTKSSIFFMKSFELYPKSDLLHRSSMLNNLALCYIKLNDNQKAKSKLFNSLKLLNQIKKKTSNEKLFSVIVEGNLGTVYHNLGDLKSAIKYLEKEVNYYFSPGVNELFKTEVPLIELLILYQKTNNEELINQTLSRMNIVVSSFRKIEEYPLLSEAMFSYYTKVGEQQKALVTGQRLYKELTAFTNMNMLRSEALNDIIYSDRLTHLKNAKTSQELKVKNANIEKRFFQFISITAIFISSLIVIIGFSLNRSKKKNQKKDQLIEAQNNRLQENRNKILENENKIQEEKIVNLAMNLNIKKETEKVFLSKINELKRKKNIDTESVLKELQISVSNLMNVDKKLLFNKIETDDIVKKFKSKLSILHPSLSKTDLEYCCYFRLNMSAKEIGSIHGQSDGSIRVLKNKIKNKLELKEGITLFDYLNEIYH